VLSVSRRLPSIRYEPAGEPSLFDRWEVRSAETVQPPLAVHDPTYRSLVVELLAPYRTPGARLIGIGSGNGYGERALADAGWDVLATDPTESALRLCRAKGLTAVRFELLSHDASPGAFDAVYCDGVLGHLWDPASGSLPAWEALAAVGRPGAICLVSNDLSDDDEKPRFVVRASADAAFYRPPAGRYAAEALATGRWSLEFERLYRYDRAGVMRRREIVAARLTAARTERSGRSPGVQPA
jgi:SAM-dependent methyltransferase